MRKSRYTAEQMLAAVRMADAGTPVADVCREVGISHQTYYGWKKKFAGATLTETRRLKELEKENARLKRLVADLTLDRHALQEIVEKKL
jgi:putative transposase